MDFCHDPVCADGKCCLSCWNQQIPSSSRVGDIYHDRQMRFLLQNRYSGNIKRVTSCLLICSNTPLTKNNIAVPLRHNIFSCINKFFNSSSEPSLEENRLINCPCRFQ